MRHVLIAAAALAVSGFAGTIAANAQVYQPGAPNKVGSMCKVQTHGDDGESFGYYAPCGAQALAQAPAVERAPKYRAAYEPGGPARIGSMCKVQTHGDDGESFGYYAPCN